MQIVHDKLSNKWRVSVFKGTHNHKVVTPAGRMKINSNKYMPIVAKNLTKTFQKENLQIGKVCSVLNDMQVGFDSRDYSNT